MERIWLGLGSNIGDSPALLRQAADLVGEHCTELRCSGLWYSKARYYTDQPDFFNAVLTGLCEKSPAELLQLLQGIEAKLGRDRASAPPKGARTIDIDILLYGRRIIAQENLIIPHPGMRERKFVLLPLVELDAGLIDPVSGLPFLEYLAALPPQGIYPLGQGIYDAPCP
ncbi:MAG: 2-amino-4-hydroxy-6-hydroxymethyldihydropteridine diphosphokinase [Spirochaetia bacterium]|jgi:2-amino-4-hydroxy-6-hydroxymethyldihydropteridine diphosphokinase|nr:2-amino-4-hydroxy-6-hydroxymethyldihydropteridine diphosphokinase [Spirochaetia bacterium]